ncbi:MAG TPA: hypothetical protein P5534_00475 [Candidatus Paceibacterota bacterium]|nr:hypothetical protein [Candidatus Paceibacterota bacterium]HRZ58615.1 hypothetical protein [Candidatus Paceibacterota bacterium]
MGLVDPLPQLRTPHRIGAGLGSLGRGLLDLLQRPAIESAKIIWTSVTRRRFGAEIAEFGFTAWSS